MTGLAGDLARYGGKQELDLGDQLVDFINTALLDFTHMTVLMYMVREARDGCTVGDIAKVAGDSKGVIQKVLDRFEKLEIVRNSGGLFGRKYMYQRDGARATQVSRLLKLWEHKTAHSEILKRILAPKK